MRRRPGYDPAARRSAIMVGAIFALAIFVSVQVIAQELVVRDAEAALDRSANPKPTIGGMPAVATVAVLPMDAPPRALFANIALRARVAQRSTDPDTRQRLLDGAARGVDALRKARPYWGELWATAAYIESMRRGPTSPGVVTALQRSYYDAPYLRQAGPWRIGYVFTHWDALTDSLQSHAADEAVWLARDDPATLDAMLDATRGTAAYRPFILRWIASRNGDAGFRPLDAATP